MMSAKQSRQLAELVDNQTSFPSQIEVTPPLFYEQAFGRQLLRFDSDFLPPGCFFAEILGNTGSAYTWAERIETAAGTWANGELAGTLNAYYAQGATPSSDVVAAGTVVIMRQSPTVPGVYEFLLMPTGSGEITNTNTPAATEMTLDTFEAAPKVAYSRTDFSVAKGATTADPKTVFLKWASPLTFLEKLCPTYKWLSIVDGVLNASDTDDGGVKVLADLTPQRKTFTPPNGMTITDVTCTGLDTTCCASTWWCTGPDGSPSWTVVEVDYGDTPPVGGFGPYTTEADAIAACVDPGGTPVEVGCCPDNPLPRALVLTEIGGGSYPLVYDAAFGAGAWLSFPSDTVNYPGVIGTIGCQFRLTLNAAGACSITANWDGAFHCAATSIDNVVITCDPFSYSFDMTFGTSGGVCDCVGETRSFIITT